MKDQWNRRTFLSSLAGFLACTQDPKTSTGDSGSGETSTNPGICDPSASLHLLADGSDLPTPELPSDPFLLGVASGSPLHDSVILWTRLYMDHNASDGLGGFSEEPIPVQWEIANDADFQDILQSGIVATRFELAHAVHIDVGDLQADRFYYYRFSIGQWTSPTGRTRTAPCIGASVSSLRIAATTCQRYEDGFFTALSNIPIDNPDIVFHLGDYIYEYGYSEVVRIQPDPSISDLAGYRRRYALYKMDPHLRAAHQTCPWEVIWDDHEVKNNYYGDGASAQMRQRMELAFLAFYENQPLRFIPPDSDEFHIYRRFDWGDLARFHLLDTRQYRTRPSCEDAEFNDCPTLDDPNQLMLGTVQEEWLKEGLSDATTTWNIIGQQVVMSNFGLFTGLFNFDQWDGYPLARQRLLDHIINEPIRNVIILTGDVHIGGVGHLHTNVDDFSSQPIAVELVTPSITSTGDELADTGAVIEEALSLQGNVEFIHASKRGYIRLDITHNHAIVRFQMAQSILTEQAAVETEAMFQIHKDSLQIEELMNIRNVPTTD